jgi:hypothetical protein
MKVYNLTTRFPYLLQKQIILDIYLLHNLQFIALTLLHVQ